MIAACRPLRPLVRQTRKRGEWMLCETVVIENGYRRWRIPEGFRFDYASVPRLARPLMQTTDLGTAGPCSHDFLYRRGGVVQAIDGGTLRYTRTEADRLFLALMESDGVPRWRRFPAYWAVRFGGGGAWQDLPKQRRAA